MLSKKMKKSEKQEHFLWISPESMKTVPQSDFHDLFHTNPM